MRDMYADKDIASYFIKTVALWVSDEKDHSFWSQNSLSYVFMTVGFKNLNYKLSSLNKMMGYCNILREEIR